MKPAPLAALLACACARNVAPPPLPAGLAMADVTVKVYAPMIEALKLEPPRLEAVEHDGKVHSWRIQHGGLKESTEPQPRRDEQQPPFPSEPPPSCRALYDAKGHTVPVNMRAHVNETVVIRTEGEVVGSRFQVTGAGTCSERVPGQGCDPQPSQVFCKRELIEERVTLEMASCLKVPLAPLPVLRAAAAAEGQVLHVAVATVADGEVSVRYLQLEACR